MSATAVVIGFGFSAANQLYGLAGSLMPRREAGNAMGIVSLGAGLFGYFGPQMLGILRDTTGSFAAGFYMVGRRGSLDARVDRAALSDDSTRNVTRGRRCIGA